MRILMLVGFMLVKSPALSKFLYKVLVCILEEHSPDHIYLRKKCSIAGDGINHGEAVTSADEKVICAKRGGLMY